MRPLIPAMLSFPLRVYTPKRQLGGGTRQSHCQAFAHLYVRHASASSKHATLRAWVPWTAKRSGAATFPCPPRAHTCSFAARLLLSSTPKLRLRVAPRRTPLAASPGHCPGTPLSPPWKSPGRGDGDLTHTAHSRPPERIRAMRGLTCEPRSPLPGLWWFRGGVTQGSLRSPWATDDRPYGAQETEEAGGTAWGRCPLIGGG